MLEAIVGGLAESHIYESTNTEEAHKPHRRLSARRSLMLGSSSSDDKTDDAQPSNQSSKSRSVDKSEVPEVRSAKEAKGDTKGGLGSLPATAAETSLRELAKKGAVMAKDKGSAAEEHSTLEDNDHDLLKKATEAMMLREEKEDSDSNDPAVKGFLNWRLTSQTGKYMRSIVRTLGGGKRHLSWTADCDI